MVKNKLMGSMVEGTPLQALCGKVWVPSRDPNKYPVCPECKEIYDKVPKGDDGGDNQSYVATRSPAARCSRTSRRPAR